MKKIARVPNTWAPPASQVQSARRVAPTVLEAPTPPKAAAPPAASVMPVARKTNLRMEAAAGRAEVAAEYIADPRPVFGVRGQSVHDAMLSQSFSVTPELVAAGGRMELCDGLLYVQHATFHMTAETVRGVGEEGLALMAAAKLVVDRDRPTGSMMSERQRAQAEKSKGEEWWAAPVSEVMAPIGFAIFQAVLSGRHTMAITPEIYMVWMKALARLKADLGIVELRMGSLAPTPFGRPMVKSSPMRATFDARTPAELALYLETARAVYTESSSDLRAVLADDWPESWGSQPGYREQLLQKVVADAAQSGTMAADQMRRILGTQPAP